MSTARYNDALKPLAPGDRVRAAVNAERQNALATLAQEAVQGVYIKGSGGIRVRSGAHGTTITQKKAIAQRGGSGVKALQVRTRTVEEVLQATVAPGTILYEMPTIGGDALDLVPAPFIELAGTGTEYVICTITGTLAVTDSIFVRPAFSSITSVVISVSATAPTGADMISSTGVFKFLLATFVDGVKTAQNGYGPITGELCDDLSGTATAQLNLIWTES